MLKSATVVKDDFLIWVSRKILYLGLAASSILVPRVGAFTLGDLLLVVSLAVALIAVEKPAFPRYAVAGFSTVVLVFGGLLAVLDSPRPEEGTLVLARVLFLAAALPVLVAGLLRDERTIINGAQATAIGAAICGAGTLLQYFVSPTIIPGTDVTTAGRFSGFTAHVSDTGGITALGVVYAVAMFGSRLDKGRSVITFLVFAGSAIGLVLSGSVSGMLSAIAASLVVLALRRVSFKQFVLLAGAAVIAAYVASTVLSQTQTALNPWERVLQVFGFTATSASLNTSDSRGDTIIAGWEGFLANPFTGVGLDTEASLIIGSLPVHNIAVAALYQGGLFFALGLIGVIVGALLKGGKNLRRNQPKIVVLGMALTAVAFALTASSFYNRYFWIPLALVIAASVLPPLTEAGEGSPNRAKLLGHPAGVSGPQFLHVKGRPGTPVKPKVSRPAARRYNASR